MSKMIEAYRNYLADWQAKHPAMPEPQLINLGMSEEMPEEIAAASARHEKELCRICKVWDDFGLVVQAVSGRVYEVCCRNNRTLIAVFENEHDWRTYDHPQTINRYFEQW